MYLDTDILVALIKPNDRHSTFALAVINREDARVYSSAIAIVELQIVIQREMGELASHNAGAMLKRILPRLEIVPLGADIVEQSVGLRKKFGLGIFDALHAATALAHDKKIASTDHIYKKVQGLRQISPLSTEWKK